MSHLTIPEGVSHSVFETDEVLLVLGHQIPGVEVGVSLHKDVPHQPLLRQLFAPSVAEERTGGAYLRQ